MFDIISTSKHNSICDEMISVLASSVVDRRFMPRQGQTNDN